MAGAVVGHRLSTCIAHGIDMSKSMTDEKDAGQDSSGPSTASSRRGWRTASRSSWIRTSRSIRWRLRGHRDPLRHPERTVPPRARVLASLLQADADERWRYYQRARRSPDRAAGGPELTAPPDHEGDDGGFVRRRSVTGPDLTTHYLGLELRSPSSPPRPARRPDGARRVETPAPPHRAVVAVRGGDPPRGDRAGRWRRARIRSPRRSTSSRHRRSPTSATGA